MVDTCYCDCTMGALHKRGQNKHVKPTSTTDLHCKIYIHHKLDQ